MKIKRDETAAIVVDIQERLLPAIEDGAAVIEASVKLIEGLNVLGIPIITARQYPKGLGDTVPEIRQALGEHQPYDKVDFSVCDEGGIKEKLNELGRKNIIVIGTEAHICVLQSVIDIAASGMQPVLVCDCIGSRKNYDKKIALKRAQAEGALLTTCEAILFELLGRAGSDEFKAISRIIK